jgi:hypothetical protein
MILPNDALNPHYARAPTDFYNPNNDFDDGMSMYSMVPVHQSLHSNGDYLDKNIQSFLMDLEQQPFSFHDELADKVSHHSASRYDDDSQNDNTDKLQSFYSQIQKCFDESFTDFATKLLRQNRRIDPSDLANFDNKNLSEELKLNFNSLLHSKLSEKANRTVQISDKMLRINRHIVDLRSKMDELMRIREIEAENHRNYQEGNFTAKEFDKGKKEIKKLQKEQLRLTTILNELQSRSVWLSRLRCKKFLIGFAKTQVDNNE